MRWFASLVLVGLALAVTAPDGSAQWFGGKKTKTPPQQRVPELFAILKYDKDATKRADAAEELRQYDPKEFPELYQYLIEALQGDAAVSVRLEAATSLGRLRPFSVAAAQALEKAWSADANIRVRLQAKTSLTYYQMSGYHAPKKTEPAGPVVKGRTDEPPLAGPPDRWWQNGPPTGNAPPVLLTPASSPSAYRPLPTGPVLDPQVPVTTVPATPPQSAPAQGPVIVPNAPVLQPTPQPTWSPVQPTGPTLMPPKV